MNNNYNQYMIGSSRLRFEVDRARSEATSGLIRGLGINELSRRRTGELVRRAYGASALTHKINHLLRIK